MKWEKENLCKLSKDIHYKRSWFVDRHLDQLNEYRSRQSYRQLIVFVHLWPLYTHLYSCICNACMCGGFLKQENYCYSFNNVFETINDNQFGQMLSFVLFLSIQLSNVVCTVIYWKWWKKRKTLRVFYTTLAIQYVSCKINKMINMLCFIGRYYFR